MSQRDKIHAQVDMYLEDSFPDKVNAGDDWLLNTNPFIVARLAPTGLDLESFPRFYFVLEAELIDGVKETPFFNKLLAHLNGKYYYLKLVALQSKNRVSMWAKVEIPADDLQKREVIFAIFMILGALDILPDRIKRALKTKSLG